MEICISDKALDVLMPMHLVVDADEKIVHAGPTIAKVCASEPLLGRPFFDVFEPRRRGARLSMAQACKQSGNKARLRLRHDPETSLVGSGFALPDGGGMVINLSFGISVIDAVARYSLAGSDFAATDLTLEMLYLVEANSAAMHESRNLNLRLNGARLAAEDDAASDMLTGLQNRRVLDQVLARKIDRGEPFTLLHLDLDYFKSVNDTFGHGAGDHVLVEVARILKEETRASDTVARVGGDEFVLIIDGKTSREKLDGIARRLIERLEIPIEYRGDICRISGSIGITESGYYRVPDAEKMMEDADKALYASKAAGRARHTIFPRDLPDQAESGAAVAS